MPHNRWIEQLGKPSSLYSIQSVSLFTAIAACLWLNRAFALIFVTFFLLFFVGNGGWNPFAMTWSENLMMIFMFCMVSGLAIGWFRETLGGSVTLAGVLGFNVVEWIVSGKFPSAILLYSPAIPAIVFIIIGIILHQVQRPTQDR